MKIFLDPSSSNSISFNKLSQEFEIKEYQDNHIDDEAFLVFYDNILFIKQKNLKPIYCDFLSDQFLKEVKQGYGRSEAIFKFLKTKEPLNVLDLTLGFGRDFFKGVLSGHNMLGLERDPVIFSLLEDGIRRFNESSRIKDLKEKFRIDEFKIKIHNKEALDFLKNDLSYDIIFYDPMFDKDAKSGKAKKSVQLLRDFVDLSKNDEINNLIKIASKKTKQFILKADASFKLDEAKIKSVHKGKGYKFIVL